MKSKIPIKIKKERCNVLKEKRNPIKNGEKGEKKGKEFGLFHKRSLIGLSLENNRRKEEKSPGIERKRISKSKVHERDEVNCRERTKEK